MMSSDDWKLYENSAKLKQAELDRAYKLLREHGFELGVGACGCCDSPWIHLKYQGETIFRHDGVSFDMVSVAGS